MKSALIQIAVGLAVVAILWGLNSAFETNLNPYYLRVIINCGVAIILALSLNLINGCAGQFSLGHAGFMGVGAYISAILTTLLPFGAFFQTPVGIGSAVVLGGLGAAAAGYLVGLPSLRLKGDYLAIVTLGFGEIIRIIFLNIEAVGGARGMTAIPRVSDFFWVYLWAAVTFICLNRLMASSVGRAILSVRENDVAAEAMGINVSKYKIIAFVISSFFAGVAGGLFAHFQGFIDPSSFSFQRSVEVVIMVVIGGMGSLSGAVLGGIIVTMLPEALRIFSEYRLVIFPAILILLMLVRPLGILGRQEVWDFFKKKPSKPKAAGKVAESAE
jgi:branched-chain amino acid transport system permease protein